MQIFTDGLYVIISLTEHESLVIISLFSCSCNNIILNGKLELFKIFGRTEFPTFMSHWDTSSVALNFFPLGIAEHVKY